MSLWWTNRGNLDDTQVSLIEDLPLTESHLILGPPGSGKTNVLLRRAQFVRSQQMPNVMVLTFTRSLTEFVKTGCEDAQGREIFPRGCISTLESWFRGLHRDHNAETPARTGSIPEQKAALAKSAETLAKVGLKPPYDAIFVDEAQDLLPEEVDALFAWARVLFFVGDDRQKIYDHGNGLGALRALPVPPREHLLPFHYRVARELCEVADRVLQTASGESLRATSLYKGPSPGRIDIHPAPTKAEQIRLAAARLWDQLRAYGGLLQEGDLLGIIVPRRDDRTLLHNALEADANLVGKSQIIRANSGDPSDRGFDVAIDRSKPIAIVTEQGAKGLEFRAVHWLFVDELAHYRTNEKYYTIITRAKTSLDIYYSGNLPETLARAYAPPVSDIWA